MSVYMYMLKTLTHLSLASLLWDIGKQHSPRCDAAERGVPSWAFLSAWRNFTKTEIKITPNNAKNESGVTQLIMMGKSIRQIWVNDNVLPHRKLLGAKA